MKDLFTKNWIIEKGIPIVESYNGNLTLRALHYRLVALGMTNDVNHYKRVVNAMIEARKSGIVEYDAFMDHERETHGSTDFETTTVLSKVYEAEHQIKLWATSYRKNRWENQPWYPEVFIEKKALQGVFLEPCKKMNIALNPCKGYPSLTFIFEAKKRFDKAIEECKKPIILYFGDYDPSGEDIPRSIKQTLQDMGTEVEIRRIALMEHQVVEWELPPAPSKTSDTRNAKWTGLGQVELDAVDPSKIKRLCMDSINEIFDYGLYEELTDQQDLERKEFKEILIKDFKTLLD